MQWGIGVETNSKMVEIDSEFGEVYDDHSENYLVRAPATGSEQAPGAYGPASSCGVRNSLRSRTTFAICSSFQSVLPIKNNPAQPCSLSDYKHYKSWYKR